MYTLLFKNPVLYIFNKVEDILCSRSALVYDKAGVLLADLCSADGTALEAAFLNQSTCKMACGTFKCAASTRKFERLLILASL